MMMIAMKKIMTNFKGHTSVIAALLESPRTKVNRTVSGGWTALMWALRGEQWKITDYLLRSAANDPGTISRLLNVHSKSGLSPILLSVERYPNMMALVV